MRKFLITYFPTSLLLAFLAIILWACGGGGGGDGGPTTSTVSGSVSGTLILAVDENGKIAAQDDTSGKMPDTNGHFPFSLTVPGGHEYTIYFVLTAEDRIAPLFSGTTNIFSIVAGKSIDLGYVDTAGNNAAAEKDPLTNPGITSGGTTGPDTITVAGSYTWLLMMDRSDVGKKYRTQVQGNNPEGSALTNGAFVKDVVVYDPDWQELLPEGSFFYWDGLSMYSDTGSGPGPTPTSEIEAYLSATAGSLSDGFYTELITDSNRNLHLVKFWHEQPTEVAKPTNLAQNVNPDNSVTLSWTNPAGIAGPANVLKVEVLHRDENGDGSKDIALLVSLNATANSYTIPASFVNSNLAGKQGLTWRVQVRQVAGPILFPDGSTRTVQIYRNYSADQALPVGPSTIPFTPGMLSGAMLFEENLAGGYESTLSIFNADSTFEQYSLEFGTSHYNTGTWSVDGSGNLIVNIAGQGTVTVMLFADSTTEMEVVIDDGTGTPFTTILEKIVPVDPSLLPGTYAGSDGYTWIFNADGTGTVSIFGTLTFTWSVDSGILKMPSSTGYSMWIYARASSQTTATSYTILKAGFTEFTPGGGFYTYHGGIDLTRQ